MSFRLSTRAVLGGLCGVFAEDASEFLVSVGVAGQAVVQQPTDQLLQAGDAVLRGGTARHLPVGIDDAARMVALGPIDTRADSRQGAISGDTNVGFLTVAAVGSHPVVPGRRSLSLTDRRFAGVQPRSRSGRPRPPDPAELQVSPSKIERPHQRLDGDKGCVTGVSGTTNRRIVHQ